MHIKHYDSQGKDALIFVTGGTGLLGNSIVRELCSRGLKVRVLCRPGTAPEPFDGLPVEIVQGDLSSQEKVQEYVAGCTAVVHSAAMIHIGWQRLEESREVNVEGTSRIVNACIKHNAKLLHVSTVDTLPAAKSLSEPIDESGEGGVEKTPCSYVLSKIEAEQVVAAAIRERQLQACILLPGFMLGPYDWKPSSGRMMLEVNKAPIVAAPPGGCSFCDSRDVAIAIVNAIGLGRLGQRYILAGKNMCYQDFWRQILKATGRKKHVFRLGPVALLAGPVLDCLNRVLGLSEGDINGAAMAMGSLKHYYNSGLAERELQYVRRPAEETLASAWEWLQQR